MTNYKKELTIRGIKLLDMGYSGSVYILSAIFLVALTNKIEGKYNEYEEEKKTTVRLIMNVILHIWLITILAYIVRNIFHMIPWPFEGVYGYKHMKVKEVIHSTVFVSFMVIFDKQLQGRIGILKKRFSEMY